MFDPTLEGNKSTYKVKYKSGNILAILQIFLIIYNVKHTSSMPKGWTAFFLKQGPLAY